VLIDAYGRSRAMAIDWIARNLYWIDSTVSGIQVVSLDTKFRTILISENLTSVQSLAVDPRAP